MAGLGEGLGLRTTRVIAIRTNSRSAAGGGICRYDLHRRSGGRTSGESILATRFLLAVVHCYVRRDVRDDVCALTIDFCRFLSLQPAPWLGVNKARREPICSNFCRKTDRTSGLAVAPWRQSAAPGHTCDSRKTPFQTSPTSPALSGAPRPARKHTATLAGSCTEKLKLEGLGNHNHRRRLPPRRRVHFLGICSWPTALSPSVSRRVALHEFPNSLQRTCRLDRFDVGTVTSG
ncbi:hypothetical protein LXA43DRAFT_213565 [Ganoderma leucocontextum]|nr:hypothetical protein LXA43DRAFT_213565 [Ganoderma leucocontextum]